jgi:hypothetical protein
MSAIAVAGYTVEILDSDFEPPGNPSKSMGYFPESAKVGHLTNTLILLTKRSNVRNRLLPQKPSRLASQSNFGARLGMSAARTLSLSRLRLTDGDLLFSRPTRVFL